jgi:hypothetical protein
MNRKGVQDPRTGRPLPKCPEDQPPFVRLTTLCFDKASPQRPVSLAGPQLSSPFPEPKLCFGDLYRAQARKVSCRSEKTPKARHNSPRGGWTPERDALLLGLKQNNWPYKEIADRLNKEFPNLLRVRPDTCAGRFSRIKRR